MLWPVFSETTPFCFFCPPFVFQTSSPILCKATSLGLQRSCTDPVLVTTAQGLAGREQKRERNEGRMKEHRQVSDIGADSASPAALSNDPDTVFPGRDYPMTQLSALKSVMRRWWRGSKSLREGLDSDKVERGTDSDMEERLRVTERGGGGVGGSHSVSVTESADRNVGLDDKPLKPQRVQ